MPSTVPAGPWESNPVALEQPVTALETFLASGAHCHRAGDWQRAATFYRRVIDLDPGHADALHLLGLVLRELGQTGPAAGLIARASAIAPGDSEILANLATVLVDAGRLEEAVAALDRAIALAPDRAELYYNLGVCRLARKEGPRAALAFERAIALDPDLAEAHNNLGTIHQAEGKIEAAARCFSRALSLVPGYVDAMGNLADCLASADRLDQARQWLEQAIALEPDRAALHYNLGNTYKAAGCLEEAVGCFDRALKLAPDDPMVRWNRSLALLAAGRFTEAWPDYEQRFAKPDWPTVYPFRHRLPLWDGKPFAGRLLVHDEQGFGDAMQFVRFLPQVKAMGMTVVFETRRPLRDLMATAAGMDEIVDRPLDGPGDWECVARVALLSLAGRLNTTLDTIPAQVPYLRADRQKSDHWRHRLAGPGFKVGLVWAGNPNHGNDKNRSIALERFRALAGMDGVRLFGLQKGPASTQPGRDLLEASLGEELDDFTDTAALMSALDLIITVDTAAAHLAGALARPVWVLVPALRSDWRWLTGRNDSPWYPTMRVLRQSGAGRWEDTLAGLVAPMRALALSQGPACRYPACQDRGKGGFR